MQKYKKEHANVIAQVLDLEITCDSAQMLNFESGEGTDHTAYVKLDGDYDIFVVFNLPGATNKIFFTVTDGDPEVVSYLVSEIEQADILHNFRVRDTVRFNHEYLVQNAKVGVLLLPIAVSNVLSGLKDIHNLEGDKYELYLCTFISAEDYAFQRNFGFDELMDKFSRENRDLIAIG